MESRRELTYRDPDIQMTGRILRPVTLNMDMVAHFGNSVAGSHVHSLVLNNEPVKSWEFLRERGVAPKLLSH